MYLNVPEWIINDYDLWFMLWSYRLWGGACRLILLYIWFILLNIYSTLYNNKTTWDPGMWLKNQQVGLQRDSILDEPEGRIIRPVWYPSATQQGGFIVPYQGPMWFFCFLFFSHTWFLLQDVVWQKILRPPYHVQIGRGTAPSTW